MQVHAHKFTIHTCKCVCVCTPLRTYCWYIGNLLAKLLRAAFVCAEPSTPGFFYKYAGISYLRLCISKYVCSSRCVCMCAVLPSKLIEIENLLPFNCCCCSCCSWRSLLRILHTLTYPSILFMVLFFQIYCFFYCCCKFHRRL